MTEITDKRMTDTAQASTYAEGFAQGFKKAIEECASIADGYGDCEIRDAILEWLEAPVVR